MFGLFKKKPPTSALDEFIFATYGDPPPPKRARLGEAVSLAYEQLLGRLASREAVESIATALNDGPVPYSTHDLAMSAALALYKNPDFAPRLAPAQLASRLQVLEWFKAGKVVAPLVKSYEDTLYALYKAHPTTVETKAPDAKLPSPFESLAAISKFMAVASMNPDFYARHQHAVEFTNSFTRLLVSSYPATESAFRRALAAPLSEGAEGIQQALSTIRLTERDVKWFDSQMTEVLRILVPVVRDKALPAWLGDCRRAVEGAFE